MSHGHVPSPQPGSHLLRPRSFPSPTKCLRCTSLMLGLSRQGLGCDGETPTPPMHPPSDTSHSPWVEGMKVALILTHPGCFSQPRLRLPLLSFGFSFLTWRIDDSSGATMASGKLGLGTPRILVPGCPHPASTICVSCFPHSLRLLLSFDLCPTSPTLPRTP